MQKEKTVIIIDDDARNIFALKAVLKARGIASLSANDIYEGLELLNANKDISAILLDMMMPDIDGFEAIKILKKSPAFAHIPVIAVTAKAMQGDKEKTLEAGADAYVAKPVDIDILMQTLQPYFKEDAAG